MSDIAGQVKDAVKKSHEKVAEAAAHTSAKVAEISVKVKDAGGRAVDTVRDQYGHLEQHAKEAYGRARQKGQDLEHDLESYVQRQPLISLLIAAGVGVMLGLLWKRRK
jgi:ElaB/YqjD/DUF883 family membrane-anchored ribosome-binding protein